MASSPNTRDCVAIVTGATGGIGLATSKRLAADGFAVVGTARHPTAELEAAAATVVAADLTDPATGKEIVDAALAAHGRIDVLVNNAGVFTARLDGFDAIGDEDWQGALEINFLSAVRLIRAALPALRESSGAIVDVSSIIARLPEAPVVDYAAAKAALNAVTASLAGELAADGVRVNTVSPGPTMSPAWETDDGFGAALAADAGQELDEFVAGFPEQAGLATGRMNEPEEVAEVIALLASGRLRNATGANFVVDGGQDKSGY